jgi:choice-of-anchor B domain-containing protein
MLVLDDELDEQESAGAGSQQFPVTYFWDISSLEAPVLTGYFRNEYAQSIDHNQFVVNGATYQSNYGAGLHVLDLSSLSTDPTGAGVSEVGFFDVYPEDDMLPTGGGLGFVGTWANYPFFPSGFIVVNTIERGAFVVKRSRSDA